MSRVLRQTLTMEVYAIVPDDSEQTGDLLGGVDLEAHVRAWAQHNDHSGGPTTWLVAGDSNVSKVEELTP